MHLMTLLLLQILLLLLLTFSETVKQMKTVPKGVCVESFGEELPRHFGLIIKGNVDASALPHHIYIYFQNPIRSFRNVHGSSSLMSPQNNYRCDSLLIL